MVATGGAGEDAGGRRPATHSCAQRTHSPTTSPPTANTRSRTPAPCILQIAKMLQRQSTAARLARDGAGPRVLPALPHVVRASPPKSDGPSSSKAEERVELLENAVTKS